MVTIARNGVTTWLLLLLGIVVVGICGGLVEHTRVVPVQKCRDEVLTALPDGGVVSCSHPDAQLFKGYETVDGDQSMNSSIYLCRCIRPWSPPVSPKPVEEKKP